MGLPPGGEEAALLGAPHRQYTPLLGKWGAPTSGAHRRVFASWRFPCIIGPGTGIVSLS
jgi:hypothetical protein